MVASRKSRPLAGEPAPSCLYPGEAELARVILGENHARWHEIATREEGVGLPRVDPLFGGRYWPAVKAYLDKRPP
jgi:hypothetical protein